MLFKDHLDEEGAGGLWVPDKGFLSEFLFWNYSQFCVAKKVLIDHYH